MSTDAPFPRTDAWALVCHDTDPPRVVDRFARWSEADSRRNSLVAQAKERGESILLSIEDAAMLPAGVE